MDQVINVIIVLFLAVVVAGMILLFSQRTLTTTEQRLTTLGFDPETQDMQTITLPTGATSDDVKALVDACARMHQGTAKPHTCFIIRGSIPGVSSLDSTTAEGGLTISVTASSSATALFIEHKVGSLEISS